MKKADYARTDARISTVPIWRAHITLVTHNDDGSDSIEYRDCAHNHATAGAAERCSRALAAQWAKDVR